MKFKFVCFWQNLGHVRFQVTDSPHRKSLCFWAFCGWLFLAFLQVNYNASEFEINVLQACWTFVNLRIYHYFVQYLPSSWFQHTNLHSAWFDRLVTPMRVSKAPVRFHDPVYIVRPRKKTLKRFEGQPAIYDVPRRLPWLSVQESSIPVAGFGVFVREDVKAGDTISIYRAKIISEATAKKLKKKVSIQFFFHFESKNLEMWVFRAGE